MKMKEQIFNNCFTLSFKNVEMTKQFRLKISQVLSTFNLWFTGILFAVSLLLILITYFVQMKIPLDHNSTTYHIIMSSYIGIAGIFLLFFIFLCIFPRAILFQIGVHHINYILSSVLFTVLRTWIKYSLSYQTYPYYYFVLFLEFFIRLILILFGLVDQIETGVLNFINIGLLAVYLQCDAVWKDEIIHNIIFFFLIGLMVTFCAYFYQRELKKGFCLNLELELKNKWYNNILNNMSNGFLYVNNNKICFINQILIDTVFQVKKTADDALATRTEPYINSNNILHHPSTNPLDNLSQYSPKILNEIFQNITQPRDIPDQPNFSLDSWEIFLKTFKDYAEKNSNQMFVYIGRGVFRGDDEKSFIFDISCRYYKDSEGENFDLIFNDVTRTKMIEEKNAEFKYKTMFLSKIAHEFKNPIICIIELAEQSHEIFNTENVRNEGLIFQNLSLIKALSDYLLILIKDLDYFSENNHRLGSKNIHLNLSNTKLNEVFQLCEEIANGILRKYHKEQNITFSVATSEDIPDAIYTDEVKLKQILINLISNAIKFTNNGMIKLNADIRESNVLFVVSDTGIGIPDSIKSQLFKPCYSNANSANNILGTGLGLAIVYDLTSKLGKTVEFSSEVGKGSTFWFEIPIGSEVKERQKMINNSTSFPEDKIIQTCVNCLENSRSTVVIPDTSAIIIPMKEKNLLRRPSKALSDTLLDDEICDGIQDHNERQITIIVADDEAFTRQATIRILKKTAKAKSISIFILEAEDGIETLFYVFKNMLKGREIHCILSDENMQFLGGQGSAKILKSIEMEKNIPHIPFFLLTAYEGMQSDALDKIFTKPLLKSSVEEIYNSFLV